MGWDGGHLFTAQGGREQKALKHINIVLITIPTRYLIRHIPNDHPSSAFGTPIIHKEVFILVSPHYPHNIIPLRLYRVTLYTQVAHLMLNVTG